jgi:hypothetical protein
MKICKLCSSEKADKKNSHIIPKFLGKRLFANFPNRHLIVYSRDKNKIEKEQDTPKEDFILCYSCEKRFELLETYFSRRLTELFSFSLHPKKFQLDSIQNQEFIRCNFRPDLFLLFIYSLIWRSAISRLAIFKDYNLPSPVEEHIRNILNINIGYNQKDMLNNAFVPMKELNPAICVIKAKEYNDETLGIILAYQTSPNAYLLFISEFIIFFYPNIELAEFAHKYFTLNENNQVLIPLATTDQWKDLKQIIFDRLKN